MFHRKLRLWSLYGANIAISSGHRADERFATPEVVPGYPDRILPKDAAAAKILKTRTLTNLYNERPTWLDNAHRDLDAAVAAAYGWPIDIAEEEALVRLLALNLERAARGR